MKKIFESLPSGWSEKKLKKYSLFLRRGKSPEYCDENQGLIVINQDCIRWEHIDLNKIKFHVVPNRVEEDFYLRYDDILINSTGTGTIGRVNQWSYRDIHAVADSHVTILRVKKESINPKYARYFLSSGPGQRYLESICYTGSTNQIELSKRYLSKLCLPCAPLPEQKAIAGILSKVDEAIEAIEKSIKSAEQLKKSLMQNLLTGKLKPDGTWRSEDEFYVDEKLGKVPRGWEVKKVKEVIKLKNGKGNTTSNLKETPDCIYRIPVYGGNGITGYYHTPLLTKKTLIIGRVGEYCGNVFKTPKESWVTDNAMLVDRFLIDNISIDFLEVKLNSLNFKRFSDSTGQPKITQSGIGALQFTLPRDVNEQTRISGCLSSLTEVISMKKSKIHSLQTIKKSFMQNLLTGKVRLNVEKVNKLLEKV
jgi:type I restriction enzyme, S subunit